MLRNAATLTTTLALLLGLGATAGAQDDYVRYAEGATAQDGGLQTAVARFSRPSDDVEIILYGVVHIADAEYYARVDQELDSYDVVLYEGVAPGEEKPSKADKSLGELQKTMGKMLGLTFQKDGIGYEHPNRVHADMNMDELQEALGGGSINPLGQFLDEEQLESMAPFMKMAAKLGEMFMKNNPQMRDRLKRQMAQRMSESDLEQGLGEKAHQVILIDRNKVVMEHLREQLEDRDEGTIAIFYGAAHMPDFEERLAELGFERDSKRFMTAWKVGRGVEDEVVAGDAEPAEEPEPAAPEGARWF